MNGHRSGVRRRPERTLPGVAFRHNCASEAGPFEHHAKTGRGSMHVPPVSLRNVNRLVEVTTHRQRRPRRDVLREAHRRGRQPPETFR